MDPTSLPTDNLYKFMALAGLFLAGFCGWAFGKLYWQRNTARQELEIERSRQKVRFASSSAIMEAFERELKIHFDGIQRAASEAEREKSERLLDDCRAKHLAEQRVMNALTEEARFVNEKLAKMVQQQPVILRVRRVLVSAVTVGLIIATAGFWFWYVKNQWFIDEQTKADYIDHKAELADKARGRAEAAKERAAAASRKTPSSASAPSASAQP